MAHEMGQRIAELCRLRGLSQAEVERRAHLAPTSISKIKSGARVLTTEEAMVLARVLRVDITQILYDGELDEQGLCSALGTLRTQCSPRQRQAVAGLLRSLADELAPMA
jgi:transcriptional regulator with XRE-family HTH domain